jgi:hypothetical protein
MTSELLFNANTRTGCGGITPEHKLRLKFYCSWTLWDFWGFFFFWFCLFVYFLLIFVCLFVTVGFLFLFLFILHIVFFLYSQFYHHHLLIPTVTPFTLPPSPMLKSIALLPNNSLILSHPLSLFSPSNPILNQHDTRLPLPPTHSPPTDQPTMTTSYNPKPLQSLTQAPSTTTEIHTNTHKDHKNQQPSQCFPYSLTSFCSSPFSATL